MVLTAPSIFSTVFVLVSLSNCIFPCLKKEGRITVLDKIILNWKINADFYLAIIQAYLKTTFIGIIIEEEKLIKKAVIY